VSHACCVTGTGALFLTLLYFYYIFPNIVGCDHFVLFRRYETASTRLFKRGRTETIRSCTSEAAELSAAVCARNYPVSQPMRDPYLYALFTKALAKHKQLTQEAMAGQVSLRHQSKNTPNKLNWRRAGLRPPHPGMARCGAQSRTSSAFFQQYLDRKIYRFSVVNIECTYEGTR
jgi:hypothetical protein